MSGPGLGKVANPVEALTEQSADLPARQVRDALRHLHDPTRLQTHPLARRSTPASEKRASGRGKALQNLLLAAIEAMRPSAKAPGEALAGRSHQLLVLRYVEGLEVGEVQSKLAISKTEYYGEHQRAVEAVTSWLEERWQPQSDLAEISPRVVSPGPVSATLPGNAMRPALAPDELRRHNLPSQLTSFVGRQAEIANVQHVLESSRLVTLTGAGGCGKSRLVLQVASAVLDHFPDGVWYVDLAPLSDPLLVPRAIASVLAIQEDLTRDLLVTIAEHLRTRETLLILDNCEHLVTACAQVGETLLGSCPRTHLLAASREILGVRGEATFRVPSLALPDPRHSLTLPDLLQIESTRLFVERARAAAPTFQVTKTTAPAVGQICRRLDGIPLAIELAAARVRVLTVEQIASRLDDRFRLLTGGSRTAMRRQQTLRALVDWSYDLLSEADRVLFRRLAVFAGGWTLDAAEGICAGDGIDASEVLDLLTSLVDKSLVVAEGHALEERYHFLETIRQYAQDRLLAAGEAGRVRDRHRDWYLELAEKAEPELIGPRQVAWLERLAAEHDNFRTALDWCLECGPAELGLRLAGALHSFWLVRDHASEARGWLERVVKASGAELPTLARAKARLASWLYAQMADDDQAARAAVEEALALYQSLGDRHGVAWALRELGHQALFHQELDRAAPFLAAASRIATDLGDRWILAQILETQGIAAGGQDDYLIAQRYFAESLALFRATGDHRAIGTSLLYLGRATFRQGDARTASAYFEQAVAIFRQLGARMRLSRALYELGILAQNAGDPRRSQQLFEESLALGRAIGDQQVTVSALLSLGALARAVGDPERARSADDEARDIALQTGRRRLIAQVVRFWGMQAIREGDYQRGARLLAAVSATGFRRLLSFGEVLNYEQSADFLAMAKDSLGEDAYATAWAVGQAMTLEEAIAQTREEDSV